MGEIVTGCAKRQFVSHCTQASDGSDRNVGEVRVMPEGLSRVCVAQVHFDEGDLHAQQRITKRNARMRESRGIEDDEGDVSARRFVNPLDQRCLGIDLEAGQIMASFGRQLRRPSRDLVQRNRSIDARLARAEQVEVRSIEQQQMSHVAGRDDSSEFR